MLVIKSVETMNVREDHCEIETIEHDRPCCSLNYGSELPPPPSFDEREIVHGEHYTDGRGKIQVVGVTKQAAEAMGIYSKAAKSNAFLWKDLNRTKEELNYALESLVREERERKFQKEFLKKLTFWDRFKFLVLGKKYVDKMMTAQRNEFIKNGKDILKWNIIP